MGPTTAYCSEYICEYHPRVHGVYKYFGYDTNQWINLNRIRKNIRYQIINNRLKNGKYKRPLKMRIKPGLIKF